MNKFEIPVPYIASRALLYEAVLHPKPGLVDSIDTGSHSDMNIYTFLDSTIALMPYFNRYFQAGLDHTGSLKDLFEILRQIGIKAEKSMFQATNNVNTHKGANFSFSVILGSTGYYFKKNPHGKYEARDSIEILEIVKLMTKDLIKEDLHNLNPKEHLTNGERVYVEKGRTGIRGEAAAGYPALNKLLLPYFRNHSNLDSQYLLLSGLLLLMSEIEDANILHRGSEDDWIKVKNDSLKIFSNAKSLYELEHEMKAYNNVLKEQHLSPGGAADLLSLGIYFALLEGII